MSANHNRMIAVVATVVVGAAGALVVQLAAADLVATLVALLVALLAGGVVLAVLGREQPGGASPAGPDDSADRAVLVALSLYLRDRLTSAALTERLDRDLARVGVLPVEPVGERFDPQVHAAEGAEPTTDDALVGTIAIVAAPGYADRGVLLRPPSVTVYQPAPGQAS
jgi:hypothetical protein